MKKGLRIIGGILIILFLISLTMRFMLANLIGIILLVIGVVCLIMSTKVIDKENSGAKIISFCFPIIGLIIYAVNIGKNDKLAKECSKWALLGLVILPITSLIIFLIFNVIG